MYLSIVLPVLLGGQSALAATPGSNFAALPAAAQYVKRQLETCAQTYGAGSVRCGDANSTFLLQPQQGDRRVSAPKAFARPAAR